tara:strand:+ start:305 stop:883 length:579 start_codon:yes stop_codon:yes gene_type:complete
MSLSLYKPNAKNAGCGFSFQPGLDAKTRDPSFYVKAIKQHSWDSSKKRGYFQGNVGKTDKNIIVKFNEYELGSFIHAFKTRTEYNTFHTFKDDKTIIKLAPWDKKAKKSVKNEETGQWEDQWLTVDAFSLSLTRNGNQQFGIGVEPGEAEVISELMKFSLNNLFKVRLNKQIENVREEFKSKEEDRDVEVPF